MYTCVEPNGLYLDPTSSYSFIHCFEGVPHRKKCEPKGTVFVKDKKTCTWTSEELPFTLKLFKGFIWFIKYTGIVYINLNHFMKFEGEFKLLIILFDCITLLHRDTTRFEQLSFIQSYLFDHGFHHYRLCSHPSTLFLHFHNSFSVQPVERSNQVQRVVKFCPRFK